MVTAQSLLFVQKFAKLVHGFVAEKRAAHVHSSIDEVHTNHSVTVQVLFTCEISKSKSLLHTTQK